MIEGIHVHNNSECLKCQAVELEMRRVGALVFCAKCASEEFKTSDPVREERALYTKWLATYAGKHL